MSVSEDLINFDIIENQKENIQTLPGGRSAKALATHFAPLSKSSGGTPGATRNLNDAIREEYEQELRSIQDSDDPLDVYDRYVKWTLSAYPSAQATSESQLRPLLERATKAFQTASHYKNDPRYLKLWLNYIRFFSDAPRETFAYLARHNIGEGLALFYEDFAAWLEGVGRWRQADEVYKLGIEREARPVERLARKSAEFQHRFEARVVNGEEPSSPALPTVRPALAAKVDPFSITSPRSDDPQASRPQAAIIGASTARGGRQKLAIFSDADDLQAVATIGSNDSSKGWNSIGSLADRKKENSIEARPWAGETLKTAKRSTGAPKMAVFKDESGFPSSVLQTNPLNQQHEQQQITNPKTGKIERVYVSLEAIYPNSENIHEEYSFEELRAKARGWQSRDWTIPRKGSLGKRPDDLKLIALHTQASDAFVAEIDQLEKNSAATATELGNEVSDHHEPSYQVETTIAIDISKEGKVGRNKRMKVKEIKGETQMIKTNLESPTGPKLRRKLSAEPTMTLHTRAATDDILDIFNQPLRNVDPMSGPPESEGETDYDDDDDYTSAGESTGTGRISGTSDFGDTDRNIKTTTESAETIGDSVSPWSDFTASKHVPKIESEDSEAGDTTNRTDSHVVQVYQDAGVVSASQTAESTREIVPESDEPSVTTPASPQRENELPRTRFVPIPPEDYQPPERYPRDPQAIAQSRLPFMTPIIEKTETSLGHFSVEQDKEYFSSKTPSRKCGTSRTTPMISEEPLSSPFQEIVNEARPARVPKLKIGPSKASTESPVSKGGPLIKDRQCNPVDEAIRQTILQNVEPPISSYKHFYDQRPDTCNRASEIRKFIKSLARVKPSDKTTASLSLPPVLRFANLPEKTYTIRKELGKGAFAPVYLAEEQSVNVEDETSALVAIKCEDPPTAWEFHIMNLLHTRLASNHRASASLLRPHSLHLFQDEGYLIEEYLDQGTLLDLVNIAKSDPTSGQTTLDEGLAMFFSIEALRTIEAMHNIGLLHGDLKADNCLVRLGNSTNDDQWNAQYSANGDGGWSGRGLTFIDFGRGIDLHAFGPDTQFIADWKTGKQDCIEMRELKPWTYQIDYFGLAGIIHSLLFGKYIEDVEVIDTASATTVGAINPPTSPSGGTIGITTKKRYKIREPLKRYWQTEIWSAVFDTLLNPTSCPAPDFTTTVGPTASAKRTLPITDNLVSLRETMEAWLEGEGGKRNGGLKYNLRKLEEKIKERRRG